MCTGVGSMATSWAGSSLAANGRHSRWIVMHGFIALGIAAAGASMVDQIVHAHDASTPADTAWLLSGSVALTLVAIAITGATLEGWSRSRGDYKPTMAALLVGAVAVLALGWLQPAPWLLALLIGGVLTVVWFIAISRWLATGGGAGGRLPT